jgi:succinate-semialdehyde dehydrogenase/glutarate-semialdehyde dehydrogenase
VPQCALAIQEIFRRAGFPEGCFQTLLIETDRVRRVIEDPRVVAATLTGSTGAGSHVASAAGKQIKKTVLELGGSDPFIVMPSADLETAARTAVKARTINNGQSCIAAKRFIVAEPIADDFERRLVAGIEALVVGDPMDSATEVGPLANEAQVKTLADQIARSVGAGARLLTGGYPLKRPGYYFAPGVLTGITEGSPAYTEEIFGPIALLFRARDMDDAIRIANDSEFGLGASAWTQNQRERDRFILELEAGLVFINAMVASDPRLPFGGVKQSGYGRELSHYGIREFVNIKTVWVQDQTGGGASVRLTDSE